MSMRAVVMTIMMYMPFLLYRRNWGLHKQEVAADLIGYALVCCAKAGGTSSLPGQPEPHLDSSPETEKLFSPSDY